MSASMEREGPRGRLSWRRWLLSWALLTFWLGLLVPLVAATYYGIKKPSDFDPALRSLRTGNVVWAVRVGSASCSNDMGVQTSSSFGVNAENPGFQQDRNRVWSGDLHESHLATYLAWVRGAHWPVVFTLCRSVKPNGEISEISYGAWQNGSKPIARYLSYCVSAGLAAMVFLEVARVLQNRKKSRCLRAPWD